MQDLIPIIFFLMFIIFPATWILVEIKVKKASIRIITIISITLVTAICCLIFVAFKEMARTCYGISKEGNALGQLVKLTVEKLEKGDKDLILTNFKQLDENLFRGKLTSKELEKINEQIKNNQNGTYYSLEQGKYINSKKDPN